VRCRLCLPLGAHVSRCLEAGASKTVRYQAGAW
jgi:hypothetical protein